MSTFNKYLASISSTIGLFAIANLVSIDSAQAFQTTFSNGSFESSFSTGWTTTGDSSRQGTFQTIAPPNGSNHALITTAYQARNDDYPTPTGTFNQSGTNPISASIEQSGNLQEFLGLSANSLSIARQNGSISGTRTPKEGSGFKQTFDVTEGGNATIDFSWDFLSNDGGNTILGDQDFAFFTFYNENDPVASRTVIPLNHSTGAVPTLTSTSTNFAKSGSYGSYSLNAGNLATGRYVLGYGVVDVDGSDRSSGLLVDNVNVRSVPFEFSPNLGLMLVAGIFGCDRLCRKLKTKSNIKF